MQIRLSPTSRNAPYLAHPRDFVTIKEGTPYTVPTGKVFVLTGLGSILLDNDGGSSTPTSLLADGVLAMRGGSYGPGTATVAAQLYFYPGSCTAARIPQGVAFAAAVVLTVSGGTASATDGRAWGYTAPA